MLELDNREEVEDDRVRVTSNIIGAGVVGIQRALRPFRPIIQVFLKYQRRESISRVCWMLSAMLLKASVTSLVGTIASIMRRRPQVWSKERCVKPVEGSVVTAS